MRTKYKRHVKSRKDKQLTLERQACTSQLSQDSLNRLERSLDSECVECRCTTRSNQLAYQHATNRSSGKARTSSTVASGDSAGVMPLVTVPSIQPSNPKPMMKVPL